MSLGVRPASTMASRAASAATMRSLRSCCGPATTPRPMIAYLPEDACLGTALVLLRISLSRARLAGLACGGNQAHAGADAFRQAQHAIAYFKAGERVIEQ